MSLAHRAAAFSRSFSRDPLAHWPFTSISRRAFGNTAGFRQNVYGNAHLLFHRVAHRFNGQSESTRYDNPALDELKANSLVKLEGIFAPELIQELRETIEAVNDTFGHDTSYRNAIPRDVLAREAPVVFDIFNERVVRLIEGYFRCPFMIYDAIWYRNFHVPEDVLMQSEVYSDHWHCDSTPSSELALLIVLSDVGSEDGPTMALDRHTTRRILKNGTTSRYDYGATKEFLKDTEPVRVTGPAGTALVMTTTHCLHRASVPSAGHQRDLLAFRLFPTTGRTCTTELRKTRIYRFTHPKKA